MIGRGPFLGSQASSVYPVAAGTRSENVPSAPVCVKFDPPPFALDQANISIPSNPVPPVQSAPPPSTLHTVPEIVLKVASESGLRFTPVSSSFVTVTVVRVELPNPGMNASTCHVPGPTYNVYFPFAFVIAPASKYP